MTYGNGVVQSYAFDPVSRLATLSSDLGGTSHDQTATLSYNPASQIDSLSKSNNAYAWGNHYNIDRVSAANGLNQLTAATPGGGQVSVPTLAHDARGNTSASGSTGYSYTGENRLATTTDGTYLAYEPLEGQMLKVSNGGIDTRFTWSGMQLLTELDGSNGAVLRRYVHGPGTDEPILWYEGAGLTDKRYLTADERGSIVAVTDSSANAIAINSYDEYGIPAATNLGRFQYTGQAWLPEIGMYYYKARIYSPTLGRFMQTDPIGYGDGMNWYNYVGSDPVNFTDPTGLEKICISVAVAGGVGVGNDAPTGGRREERCYNSDGGGDGGTIAKPSPTPKPKPQKEKEEGTLEKLRRCTSEQLGFGELAEAAAVAAGQPIPGTKPFVTPGSSRGTSAAGMAADRVLGKARLPSRLPTLVGGPGTGRALAIAGTKSAARFAARAVPIVGWALLAYDAASIAVCTGSDD